MKLRTSWLALAVMASCWQFSFAQETEVEAIADAGGGAIVVTSSEDDGNGNTNSSIRVMSMSGDALAGDTLFMSPMMLNSSGDSFGLLSNPSVQKDLELVEDQLDRIRQVNNDFSKQIKDKMGLFKGGDGFTMDKAKDISEVIQNLKQEQQEEINNILLPHQQDRLKQVALQMQMKGMGTASTLTRKLAEKLGLSEEQIEELKKKNKELQEEIKRKTAELKAKANDSLLEVLTSEQREMLEDMTGKKFESRSEDWAQRFKRRSKTRRRDNSDR